MMYKGVTLSSKEVKKKHNRENWRRWIPGSAKKRRVGYRERIERGKSGSRRK